MCVELAMWPFGVLFYRISYAAYISNFMGTMTLGEVLAKHLYDLFTFLVPVAMHGLPTKRKRIEKLVVNSIQLCIDTLVSLSKNPVGCK